MVFPSVILFLLEPSWSYLDCTYYVFISWTTIGLGSYIPGDGPETQPFTDIYKTSVALFLLAGLVFMALILKVFNHVCVPTGIKSHFPG